MVTTFGLNSNYFRFPDSIRAFHIQLKCSWWPSTDLTALAVNIFSWWVSTNSVGSISWYQLQTHSHSQGIINSLLSEQENNSCLFNIECHYGQFWWQPQKICRSILFSPNYSCYSVLNILSSPSENAMTSKMIPHGNHYLFPQENHLIFLVRWTLFILCMITTYFLHDNQYIFRMKPLHIPLR